MCASSGTPRTDQKCLLGRRTADDEAAFGRADGQKHRGCCDQPGTRLGPTWDQHGANMGPTWGDCPEAQQDRPADQEESGRMMED